MAIYIDAKLAEKNIDNADTSWCTDVDNIIEACIEALQSTPQADVAPAVHAYWKPSILPLLQIDWFRCSNCNASAIQTPFDIPAKTEFCPFCGAKMDEVIE